MNKNHLAVSLVQNQFMLLRSPFHRSLPRAVKAFPRMQQETYPLQQSIDRFREKLVIIRSCEWNNFSNKDLSFFFACRSSNVCDSKRRPSTAKARKVTLLSLLFTTHCFYNRVFLCRGISRDSISSNALNDAREMIFERSWNWFPGERFQPLERSSGFKKKNTIYRLIFYLFSVTS